MTFRFLIFWLLVAIPIQASAASRGLELELKSSDKANAPPAGSVQLYQASYALVIGIDRYTNGWPSLRNAVNDARAVAKKLEDHGFDVTLRENLKADDFRKTLRAFFARTGRDPEARLLLWYAGHGHTVDGEGFLVPADAPRGNDPDFLVDALPLRDFGSLVRLAKSKHVLSIFDACFAGTVFEARGGVPTAAITSKTTKPVRQFITSGDAGQQVRDDGSFREYFLRALSGDEKADFNTDGYVTGEELGLFLSQRMTALTQASQTPKSGKLHDVRYNQGDFVFALERPAEIDAPASGSGFSLGDLKKQQKQDQVRQAWANKLVEMKAAYAQTEQFEAGGGSSELKAQAWRRFVSAFAQDNPFSVEDDRLRRRAVRLSRIWAATKKTVKENAVKKRNAEFSVEIFGVRLKTNTLYKSDGVKLVDGSIPKLRKTFRIVGASRFGESGVLFTEAIGGHCGGCSNVFSAHFVKKTASGWQYTHSVEEYVDAGYFGKTFDTRIQNVGGMVLFSVVSGRMAQGYIWKNRTFSLIRENNKIIPTITINILDLGASNVGGHCPTTDPYPGGVDNDCLELRGNTEIVDSNGESYVIANYSGVFRAWECNKTEEIDESFKWKITSRGFLPIDVGYEEFRGRTGRGLAEEICSKN